MERNEKEQKNPRIIELSTTKFTFRSVNDDDNQLVRLNFSIFFFIAASIPLCLSIRPHPHPITYAYDGQDKNISHKLCDCYHIYIFIDVHTNH